MRNALRLLIFISLPYLTICGLASIVLARSTVQPYHRPLSESAENELRRFAAGLKSQVENAEINAADETPLRAWQIRASNWNGDAVILLHGLGDNRLGMQGYAEFLLRHGYTVLMPDARAHGESGGPLMTYGLLERDDVRRWFEWVKKTDRPRCIFGFAESMGAAQLLQALETEPNFCAVATESSFASFREIAYDRMGQQFHAGPWVGRTLLRPLVEFALAYVRLKYHLDLTRVSPEEAVARTQVPVLLIHGVADSNIPIRHARLIKSTNSAVELWEVAGADHCGAISVAPAELESRLVAWFQIHDRNVVAYTYDHRMSAI